MEKSLDECREKVKSIYFFYKKKKFGKKTIKIAAVTNIDLRGWRHRPDNSQIF